MRIPKYKCIDADNSEMPEKLSRALREKTKVLGLKRSYAKFELLYCYNFSILLQISSSYFFNLIIITLHSIKPDIFSLSTVCHLLIILEHILLQIMRLLLDIQNLMCFCDIIQTFIDSKQFFRLLCVCLCSICYLN